MKNRIFASFLVLAFAVLVAAPALAQENLVVVTWNIEHLSSAGRGFGGGYGGGNLPARTDEQLAQIGRFLRDELRADIVAVQEAGVGYVGPEGSRSRELDSITMAMGPGWRYALPEVGSVDPEKLELAFIWNADRVRALRIAPMRVPDIVLAGKELFDRKPLLGYFEVVGRQGQSPRNDFLLVNVHLASGQDNDENHLIALTILEYQLTSELRALGITESDRILLGDFNDNPDARTAAGAPRYTQAAWDHLAFKGYTRLRNATVTFSRMDDNLSSLIDHIVVNSSAARHLAGGLRQWLPPGGPASFAAWRRNFSDHFPLFIEIIVGADDDVD